MDKDSIISTASAIRSRLHHAIDAAATQGEKEKLGHVLQGVNLLYFSILSDMGDSAAGDLLNAFRDEMTI